jgi:hypothetical protein
VPLVFVEVKISGICGVGWGYKYDPVDMHIYSETRNRSSGGTRTVHTAVLKRMTFWYKVADEKDTVVICEIDASGGSENDVEAYAMKGAITNALGNAASNIGFQESVYLGKRSHKTVGKTSSTASGPTKPVAKPGQKPAAKGQVPVVHPDNDPANFVVTIGRFAKKDANSNRTLGEIYILEGGDKAIQFYTTMATGGDPAKDALKNAAIAFLAKRNGHVPQSVAA